jgi:hypothetical protein
MRRCGYCHAKCETHDEPRCLQHKDTHVQPPARIDPAHCHSSRDCSALGSDGKIMQGSPESFLAQHTWSNTPAQPDVTGKRAAHRGRHVLPGKDSRRFAGLRRRLSRGAWLIASCCRGFSRFGYSFNHGWKLQLGLFRSAMVAVAQRLDVGSFFFHPQLSVSIFLAFFFKVCRNRFSRHGQSVAELAPPGCPI